MFTWFYSVTSKQEKETDLCLEPLLPKTNNIPMCVCSSGVVNHEMNPLSSFEKNTESKMKKRLDKRERKILW
jgi:hypothetical protein